MFKTRLISGIFLVIAALLTIISGGYVLFVTLLCVSLLGIQELYKAMGVHKDGVGLLELAGYLGTILYYASLLLGFERYGMMAVLLGLVLLMFVYVFTYPKYEADQVMSAFFGIVYVAVMLSFIFLTRNLEGGKFLVWLIFLCSWGCDTCAYCGPIVEYAVICAVGALISMVGDLAASAIKRNRGIKDYGKLIPGHGGILDRFDSVIFTSPIIFYLAKMLLGL